MKNLIASIVAVSSLAGVVIELVRMAKDDAIETELREQARMLGLDTRRDLAAARARHAARELDAAKARELTLLEEREALLRSFTSEELQGLKSMLADKKMAADGKKMKVNEA